MDRYTPFLIACVFSSVSFWGYGLPKADISIGLGAQSGLGMSTYDLDSPTEFTVDFALRPNIGLFVASRRVSFQIDYRLDLNMKIFVGNKYRLNYFQQVGFRNVVAVNKTVTYHLQGNADWGKLGSSDASRLLNSGESLSTAQTQYSQFRYININVQTGIDKQLNRRKSVDLAIGYRTQRSFDVQPNARPFATLDAGFLQTSYLIAFPQSNQIRISARGEAVIFTPGTEFLVGEPTVEWLGSVTKTTSLRLSVGAVVGGQYIWIDDNSDDELSVLEDGEHWLWFPTASISCDKNITLTGRARFYGRLSGGINGSFNPFQATFDREGSVRLQGNININAALSITGQLSVAKWLSQVSAGGIVNNIPSAVLTNEYPILSMADLRMSYILSKNIRFHIGVSGSIRTTEFKAESFSTRNQELMVLMGIVSNYNLME